MNAVDLSRLDLNLFVVFDAIWQEGSLTRAAGRLHLTQPAVSHALARLREVCDDALFVRDGRLMQPTPRARAMAPRVQEALSALGRSLAPEPGFDPARATRGFTIGLRAAQEPFVLRALLPQLGAAAPGLDVALVRTDRARLEEELRQGRLDAALDVPLPVSRHIGRMPLRSEPMQVLARPGHPLLPDGVLTLEAYLRADHVLVSTRRSGLGLEDSALSLLGRQRRIRLRCQHYQAACAAVRHSDLLLTLPRCHAELADAAGACLHLPAPCAMPPFEVQLYWDQRRDADPAQQWLRRRLLDVLATPATAEAVPQ